MRPEAGEAERLCAEGKAALAHGDRRRAAEAYLQAGKVQFEAGYLQNAWDLFDYALQLGATCFDAYFGRGVCGYLTLRHQQAAADLSTALKYNPRDALTFYYRGAVGLELDNDRQAFDDFSAAIALDPAQRPALHERALLWLKAGRQREAVVDLSAALAAGGDPIRNLHARWYALEALGDRAAAERDLRELRALLQGQVDTISQRGQRVIGALVQANRELYAPGPTEHACLVLISFEPQFQQQPEWLAQLATHVHSLKGKEYADRDAAYVSSIVTDERAERYRRVRLPESFARGAVVYAADLWIYRCFVPGGYLRRHDLLQCVAEPGDEGRIELLPPAGVGT